jgi:putative (di)nucleoside polyphosphate hydrolase
VVNFKRDVYHRALRHFAPLVETTLCIQLGPQPQVHSRPGRGRRAA